jgi:NhaP-type Na+/H+ or K+/H+ antiporter
MKKTIIALAATMAIAGCTTAERDTATGAAIGAAVGGIATGRVGGAVAGAVVGGAAGYLIGRHERRGYCEYRNSRGRLYTARCPRGYRW